MRNGSIMVFTFLLVTSFLLTGCAGRMIKKSESIQPTIRESYSQLGNAKYTNEYSTFVDSEFLPNSESEFQKYVSMDEANKALKCSTYAEDEVLGLKRKSIRANADSVVVEYDQGMRIVKYAGTPDSSLKAGQIGNDRQADVVMNVDWDAGDTPPICKARMAFVQNGLHISFKWGDFHYWLEIPDTVSVREIDDLVRKILLNDTLNIEGRILKITDSKVEIASDAEDSGHLNIGRKELSAKTQKELSTGKQLSIQVNSRIYPAGSGIVTGIVTSSVL